MQGSEEQAMTSNRNSQVLCTVTETQLKQKPNQNDWVHYFSSQINLLTVDMLAARF